VTAHLELFEGLSLPLNTATSKLAWFGENGAGKTYGAMKLAELFWDAGIQFVTLDPVGVWPGLRTAADGKPGIPIVVFGGLNGDIPISPHHGATVAETIVGQNVSAVLDVSQFETDYAKAQFASEFAERFFFLKKGNPGAVHVFLEEAQEFVPENPAGGPKSKDTLMANRFQRLWKIGRNFGIGGSLISQRPQEISKKALNLSNAVFAFRMTGPHERSYMAKWFSGHGAEVDLPKIKTGRPYVWSAHWLETCGELTVLPKRTFDISATPEVGQANVARVLASVDVQALRQSMQEAAEEAESNDVDSLRAKIERLKAAASGQSFAEEVKARQAAEAHRDELVRRLHEIGKLAAQNAKQIARLCEVLDSVTPVTVEAVQASPPSAPVQTAEAKASVPQRNGSVLPKPHQRVLDAVNWWGQMGVYPVSRLQVAFIAGYAPNTGNFNNILSKLKSEDLVDYPAAGCVCITIKGNEASTCGVIDKGEDAAEALRSAMRAKLTGPQWRVLEPVLSAYPDAVSAADVARRAGYAPNTGNFNNIRGQLKSLGLVRYPKSGTMVATDVLFPNNVRLPA